MNHPRTHGPLSRRSLLVGGLRGAATGAALAVTAPAFARSNVLGAGAPSKHGDDPWFRISLAEWSLHRTLRKSKDDGGISNLEFPGFAKSQCGVDGVEYVNSFFQSPGQDGAMKKRGTDFGYLGELKDACRDADVESVLIMVDGEGQLADADEGARRRAISNHFKWVAAAAFLGCHSIRVNAGGRGPDGADPDPKAMADRAADSLRRIARVSDDYDVNVIVENHGGLSSDGAWLASVMRKADHPRVGTLPDFGNFYDYDRYQGVEDLMPFAKAVSAKSYAFDESGNETKIDYERMLGLVKEAGYSGWVGIEYEGSGADEVEGILATKALLESVREKLA